MNLIKTSNVYVRSSISLLSFVVTPEFLSVFSRGILKTDGRRNYSKTTNKGKEEKELSFLSGLLQKPSESVSREDPVEDTEVTTYASMISVTKQIKTNFQTEYFFIVRIRRLS